jgi:hypothetical protein
MKANPSMLFRKIIRVSFENNTNGQSAEFQDVIAGGAYREHYIYFIWLIKGAV